MYVCKCMCVYVRLSYYSANALLTFGIKLSFFSNGK